MGINQKEAVAALHRARMLTAAEELFQQKGFEATTIDDISKASGYRRRTLYAYFVNKEDFLRKIVRKNGRCLPRPQRIPSLGSPILMKPGMEPRKAWITFTCLR